MRVPAIFWWPGQIEPGIVSDPGSMLDLFATAARLSGATVDPGPDSLDLAPTLLQAETSPRDSVIYYRGGELQAYRKGQFYGMLKGTGIRFTNINADAHAVTVKTNGARRIEFITETGIAKVMSGPEGVYKIPKDTDGNPSITFVRVRALDGKGEILYSQPTLYGKPTK